MRSTRLPNPRPILIVLLATAVAAWPQPLSSVPEPPLANQATPTAASCGAVDPSLVELGLGLDRGPDPLSPGRALSVSDGTLAVLLVVAGVDETGAATSFDFQASVDVAAVLVRSAAETEVYQFQPPTLAGAALAAPAGTAIEQVAFCYGAMVTPPPPLPPEEAPRATVAARATGTAAASASAAVLIAAMATATAAIRDAGATATAAAATVAALATREAVLAATATAAAADQAAALATATALAGSARATAEALGTLRVEEALTATAFAAPTATPTPDPSSPTVLYRGGTVEGFAGWSLPPGWSETDAGLVADGATGGVWATPPFQVDDRADYAVEIEARVVGEPACEQNFGIAARGSDDGYYAAGVEWRCEPVAALWAGQERLADTPLDPGDDWRVYRIEVRGDDVRLLIDGTLVLEATDIRYQIGGEVAIWSSGAHLEVRSFIVTELLPGP